MTIHTLIAGAGPTGLTLAIDLARRGLPVRIVDKATEFFPGSRADGLQPRTLEVFDDLGVIDAIRAKATARPVFRDFLDGVEVGELRMDEDLPPNPAVPYPNPLVLGQSDTEAVLRDRLAEYGVEVELGTEVVGVEQDTEGVTVTLAHGGDVRARYLVGADGGGSFVRRALGIEFEGHTDESMRMLLGDVRADALDHEFGYALRTSADPLRAVALSPLPGGRHFQFAAPFTEQAEPTLSLLQRHVDDLAGDLAIRLTDLRWSTVWRSNTRLARRYRVGRVFLAGDAAHVHPPAGGQGLNTGVQDAYNLGWKLADGTPETLDSYEAERRPVAARVLGISTGLLRRHLDGDENAHRRGTETHQLDITYRDPDDEGALVTGDRAPDAPVLDATGNPLRLFDLFRGPHATLLRFGANTSPNTHRTEATRDPLTLPAPGASTPPAAVPAPPAAPTPPKPAPTPPAAPKPAESSSAPPSASVTPDAIPPAVRPEPDTSSAPANATPNAPGPPIVAAPSLSTRAPTPPNDAIAPNAAPPARPKTDTSSAPPNPAAPVGPDSPTATTTAPTPGEPGAAQAAPSSPRQTHPVHTWTVIRPGDPRPNTPYVTDVEGHAFAHYRAHTGDRIHVRPDGHLGHRER
ncbi:FAD-dependent monooxygenase [Nocardia puris]|uniref:FAD-dependent monooxygenase n=1 Tax=Nocardia puris TaxID=208602 RepID=UPI0018947341|nr:FAD-dependent monooxygenase [Nocardia puris]MBF6211432.1 FAD-dependent monooxygenase [Nocardia puris]MBF6458935.1 FAD-dependent monooxygenase [Nocardia puris]